MKGVIKAKSIAQSTFDEDGNPITVSATFGLPIPCKYISANRNDVVNIGDGSFMQASYIITIKDMNFTAKQVQLIDSRNNVVCEYDVKSLEVLETIKRVKIVI